MRERDMEEGWYFSHQNTEEGGTKRARQGGTAWEGGCSRSLGPAGRLTAALMKGLL